MAGFSYGLCAATASLTAYLLLRGYWARRSRLLLWSGLCFLGLAVNNVLLVVDRLIIQGADLSTVRLLPALIGMLLLLYGLIVERE